MSNFFEGREKTMRICFNLPTTRSLLDVKKETWARLLQETGCTIIGELRQKGSVAYMLSESSLFVWKDRILLKTCGTTTPLLLLPLLHSQIRWLEHFETFSYTNGAFLKPHLQPLGYRCQKELKTQVSDTLMTLSPADEEFSHYWLCAPDRSIEYLSSEAHGSAKPPFLVEVKLSKLNKRGKFYSYQHDRRAVEKLFLKMFPEPWKRDCFHFDPCGFSLNALRTDNAGFYATIHVTPEEGFSYASFETNEAGGLKDQVEVLCSLFCPEEITIKFQYRSKEVKCQLAKEVMSCMKSSYDMEYYQEMKLGEGLLVFLKYYYGQCDSLKNRKLEL